MNYYDVRDALATAFSRAACYDGEKLDHLMLVSERIEVAGVHRFWSAEMQDEMLTSESPIALPMSILLAATVYFVPIFTQIYELDELYQMADRCISACRVSGIENIATIELMGMPSAVAMGNAALSKDVDPKAFLEKNLAIVIYYLYLAYGANRLTKDMVDELNKQKKAQQ